jgi:DNA-binding CsgD family transcriptional regulator
MSCADEFERLGCRLYAAEAAAVASRLLDDAGKSQRARAASARARALAVDSGGVVTPALADLDRTPLLSEREDEIAHLAAAGMSNRAIAARLHLSVRTVDNHLHHAYEKLGIAGRDELAATLGGG